ncbi:MAG TPA: rhomboid family intramembrane serine protease [Nocardioidaceae bacterium]|nr:rhomboid family intramembrane serine protease [Nocardioidaceae bacterium]
MTEPAAPSVCYRHTTRETYISCQRCGRPICPDCMNSASVGFQCPECVSAGKKATRSGRTAYGGQLSQDSMRTSQVLVGINAFVWLVIMVTGRGGSEWLFRLGLIPDVACSEATIFGCVSLQEGVAHGAWWQLVTSMFTHVQFLHLAYNMAALWLLGPRLEVVLGRARFLALYLVSGLVGSTVVYGLSDPNDLTIGASGAVYGLLGGLLVIAHKVRGNVQDLALWVAFGFLLTIIIPNISWQAHLGGFVGGTALTAALVYAPRENRSSLQWAAIAGVTVLAVAACVARTFVLQS